MAHIFRYLWLGPFLLRTNIEANSRILRWDQVCLAWLLTLGTPQLTSWPSPSSQTQLIVVNLKPHPGIGVSIFYDTFPVCTLHVLSSWDPFTFWKMSACPLAGIDEKLKCCFSETDDALCRVLPSFVAPSDKLSSIWTLKRAHQRKVSEFKIHVVHTFAFQVSTWSEKRKTFRTKK